MGDLGMEHLFFSLNKWRRVLHLLRNNYYKYATEEISKGANTFMALYIYSKSPIQIVG